MRLLQRSPSWKVGRKVPRHCRSRAVADQPILTSDCPLFNSGHGAVFNTAGKNEMERFDAHTLRSPPPQCVDILTITPAPSPCLSHPPRNPTFPPLAPLVRPPSSRAPATPSSSPARSIFPPRRPSMSSTAGREPRRLLQV